MVIMRMQQGAVDGLPDEVSVTLSCEANALGSVDERFLEFVVPGKKRGEEFRMTFDRQELGLLTALVKRLDEHYSKEVT